MMQIKFYLLYKPEKTKRKGHIWKMYVHKKMQMNKFGINSEMTPIVYCVYTYISSFIKYGIMYVCIFVYNYLFEVASVV